MEIIAHCPRRAADVQRWLGEALTGPAQRIELDVACRDGAAVVGHDASGRGPFMGLGRALEAIAREGRDVLLDVKDAQAPIAGALARHPRLAARAIVSGRLPRDVGAARRARTLPDRDAPAGPLGVATRAARARVRAAALQSGLVCVDRRFLTAGLGEKVELIVWTVDTPRALRRARAAGAAGVVTNRPGWLAAAGGA